MSPWERERKDIRSHGMRATPSRMAVLQLMRKAARPLTHAEVYEQLSDDGLDKVTIYRNLVDLADAGLLRRLSLSDGYRFESSHEHDAHAPVHFVCTHCEVVQCLDASPLPPHQGGRGLPKSLSQGNVEIQVRGLCDQCLV